MTKIQQQNPSGKQTRTKPTQQNYTILTPWNHNPALQLPIWPDAFRSAPNALLRSALFGAVRSEDRRMFGTPGKPHEEPIGETIASQDGITISFAGRQLNQYDADVFFEAVHRVRRDPLGTVIRFTGHDFLHSIGRNNKQANYDDLHQSLTRMRNGNLVIQYQQGKKRHTFNGSLISYYEREDDSRLYVVSFAPTIKALFEPASYTQIEWEQRQRLGNKPLAQWLHSYYSTHADPLPVTVGFLQRICGSQSKRKANFKHKLTIAFAELHTHFGWLFRLEDDKIYLSKTPTQSQQQYLTNKKERATAEVRRARILQHRANLAFQPQSSLPYPNYDRPDPFDVAQATRQALYNMKGKNH